MLPEGVRPLHSLLEERSGYPHGVRPENDGLRHLNPSAEAPRGYDLEFGRLGGLDEAYRCGYPPVPEGLPQVFLIPLSLLLGDVVLHGGPARASDPAELEAGYSRRLHLDGVLVGYSAARLLHDHGCVQAARDLAHLFEDAAVVCVASDLDRLLEWVHVDGEGVGLDHLHAPPGLLRPPSQ